MEKKSHIKILVTHETSVLIFLGLKFKKRKENALLYKTALSDVLHFTSSAIIKKSEPSTASAAVTRKMCFFSANVGRKSVCSMLHSLLILCVCVFLCVCWAAETRLSVSTLWLQ